VFCPKNQELVQLLLDKKLIAQVDDIPWLATALKRDVCSSAEGPVHVAHASPTRDTGSS
jgi:hypothetical protein